MNLTVKQPDVSKDQHKESALGTDGRGKELDSNTRLRCEEMLQFWDIPTLLARKQ